MFRGVFGVYMVVYTWYNGCYIGANINMVMQVYKGHIIKGVYKALYDVTT